MQKIRTGLLALLLAGVCGAFGCGSASGGGGRNYDFSGDFGAPGDLAMRDGGPSPQDAAAPIDLAVHTDLAMVGPDAAMPGHTLVRVHYPAGNHSLSIRGSGAPLDWNQGMAMTATGGDTFTYSLDGLAAPLEIKPLLDDVTWSRGANYHIAPNQTVDLYPHFMTAKGKVVVLYNPFHSAALANDREIWAYLPPSYDENPYGRYPVLYMHDGQNLFDPNLAFGGNPWKADVALDTGADVLDNNASIRETILIAVANTPNRIWELTPTRDASVGDGGGGDTYLKMIAEELKPKVDASLRTKTGPADTAMVGSSLGGLISAHAGCKRAAVFGLIGAMSPSTWWDNLMIVNEIAKCGHTASRIYVDSGDSGTSNDDVVNTKMLADTYRSMGVGYKDGMDFMYLVQAGGQHNEVYWSQRLPGALHFLMGGY